ncbi:SDR family NAD(P)-dependent oxidoreductase [Kineococcus terrestris]|uniref:SDR family NAD(P)-dependent oxidoreductase n=1 Tax=Kineococcus terrestris TaxID=2044856 RepID=UPI0034DB0885
MRAFRFAGAEAVVTGAAHGIGRELALQLARRRSALVLLDRDGDGLAEVADLARREGVAVTGHVVDLTDPDATTRTAQRLAREHPGTTLLVNNAGAVLTGRFEQVTVEEFLWSLEVNLVAPVRLTSALLPVLRANPGSHVVFLSSLFGLVAPPGHTSYAAGKFGVRGFAEALRGELRPAGVGVTTVHPGGVATGIARGARRGSGVSAEQARTGTEQFERLLRLPPEVAARTVLDGVERRRARVLVGRDARAADALVRALPTVFPDLVARGAVRLARRLPP